jgi:nitrite reductase (NADH) large subunit
VVAATGIEPVIELATLAGLAVDRGIRVDGYLRTSAEEVFAIGECCELNGETVGLVAPIWQQVETLAANLSGEPREYRAEPYVTMLKVSGIDVHVMGDVHGDGLHCLRYEDRERGVYPQARPARWAAGGRAAVRRCHRLSALPGAAARR